MNSITSFGIACGLTLAVCIQPLLPQEESVGDENAMPLGAFSVSLAVKDIKASEAFYAKLGFRHVMGKLEQNWLILRNGDTTIGLFQGMFESNIMTFNPGWDAQNQPIKDFLDIRELQAAVKGSGIALTSEADEAGNGPASMTLMDPDGNMILIDQHVDGPK